MKILLVSGKCLSNTDRIKHCEFIKEFVDTAKFKTNRDKLAYIYPSDSSEISIENDYLINFAIKSVGDRSLQIPDFNPVAVNDIYNFFIDFDADIVISFDNGYLGLLSQVWAIQKKVPYALFNTSSKEEFKTKTSKFLRGVFKTTGLSGEFYSNFYHNCTAIFVLEADNLSKLQEIAYKGTAMLISNSLPKGRFQDMIYDELKTLINSQPHYIRSSIFKNIIDRFSFISFSSKDSKKEDKKNLNIGTMIFAGGAVMTSIVAFFAWKNLNKIKEKISKKDPN